VIALSGYALGRSWVLLEKWIGRTGLIGLVIVIGTAVFLVIRNRRQRT